MTANEFLAELSRFFLIGLVIVTAADFLLHKDRIRRDIFLMIFCLAFSNLIALLRRATGLDLAWMTPVTQVLLIAQPYLLLRIVEYFRRVPRWINQGATGGMIASWMAIIIVDPPLPRLITLAIVLYFVAVDGYAMVAFTRGAFSSVGVVKQRLRLAAIGSGLLAIALFLLGVAVIFQSAAAAISSVIQVVVICCVMAYYLGFAPPRWLRQTWQLAELRNYLQYMQGTNSTDLSEIAAGLCTAVSRTMNMDKVIVVLKKDDTEVVIHKSIGGTTLSEVNFHYNPAFQQAWQEQIPIVLYKSELLNDTIAQVMKQLNTETLMAIPIAANNRTAGLLMVFFQYGSLFPEDDLRLLSVFAQQTAVLLQNQAMLAALYEQTEELEHKVQERTTELQKSNEELQLFAYITSHDLQEPLRMISSYLQLIEKRYSNLLDKDGREFIGFAVDGATRMKALIGDVLMYSRVGTQDKDFIILNMEVILDEAMQFLEMTIKETNAIIKHDPLPQVRGDHHLMVQLFQNLLTNAIKYQAEKTPEIYIRASQDQDYWTFSVKDNGIGIEQEYLEKIFVIFQRLHDRGRYPGTGIGLAVCKKVVELHGGRIWAESKVGVGTTFYFTLPA